MHQIGGLIGLASLPVGIICAYVMAVDTYRGDIPHLSAVIVGVSTFTGTFNALFELGKWMAK